MKHLMLLLLLPVSVSAQYGFQLKGDKIYIERTFYLSEKSDKEIFNSLKIAILDEVKSERLIENVDHSMNTISANGMFEYYTKRKNKDHPTHECGYRIYGKVLNGVYTIRVTDFIGKIKDRA